MPVALSAQSRQYRLIPGGSKRCAEVHPGPSAGLPSDGRSPSRPCLQLVLLVVSISDEYLLVFVQGTSCLAVAFGEGRSPHKLTPVPGVHKSVHRIADTSSSR